MRLTRRQMGLGAIALGALILITLLAAPRTSSLRQGSTYSRSPDGYGAWFAYMEQQGTPIQRWQRPFQELLPDASSPTPPATTLSWAASHAPSSLTQAPPQPTPPSTLIQVNPGADIVLSMVEEWVQDGNVALLLGIEQVPVTAAPFRSWLDSPAGQVTIETRRRLALDNSPSSSQALLNDEFGAVVWQQTVGRGKIVYAVTPHLAANAYQDEPGNFAFLAQLATAPGLPIWVDEYIHGYRDVDERTDQQPGNVFLYLANTPLVLIAVQAGVVLLVALWGKNQRFGPPTTLTAPAIDNSEAYIQALASVLHKAGCSEFVLNALGKAEQLTIQRSLGLGNTLIERDALLAAWVQQTGRPAAELDAILRTAHRHRRVSDPDLLGWLHQVAEIQRRLP